MDEEVDIIDHHDRVVGRTTKKEAHEKGLLHRCIVSQVKNSEDQYLFVKQAADRQDAGQYVSPAGGHVTAGETANEALVREVSEELGLAAKNYEYIGKAILNRRVLNRQENHLLIVYEVYSDSKPTLSHEAESYIYLTKKDLQEEMKRHPEQFGDAFKFVIKHIYPELLIPTTK